MKPEDQALLRAPFPPERIGKIPRGGVMVDFVGHADVTDRLLSVDPSWTWEPAGTDDHGLPVLSKDGLWIKLTVCGVTRYGFGNADGKTGPDVIKVMIGDAIKNAAMRFGVALDLWSKSDPDAPTSLVKPVTDPDWLRDAAIGITEAKTSDDLATVATFIKDGVSDGKCSDDSRADLLVKWKQKEQELTHDNA